MKLTFFPGGLASMGTLQGELCHVNSSGILFATESKKVHLDMYLSGVDDVYINKNDILEVEGFRAGIRQKLVRYPDLSEIELPLKVEGEVKNIHYFDGRFLHYQKYEYPKTEMVIFDLKANRKVDIRFLAGGRYIDESTIILLKKGTLVVAYDWSGNELWQFDVFTKPIGFEPVLGSFDDNLIVGSAGDGEGRGFLVNLNRMAGGVIWKKTFEGPIDNAKLIGDKIYIARANEMSVISADNAEILLEFTAELPKGESKTTLWSDGRLLYVLASESNRLICYEEKSGEYIRTYQLPARPDLTYGDIPDSFNGVNYLGLRPGLGILTAVEGGILSWTAEDVLSGKELELEEKPSIITMVIREGDGSQSYYANIPCDNIHDVLCFGQIEALKIASLRGRQFYKNDETLNKNFNGQIKLLIDPVVGKKNRPYLDMLAKKCTIGSRSLRITSGDGKGQPIVVSWAFTDEL